MIYYNKVGKFYFDLFRTKHLVIISNYCSFVIKNKLK